MTFFRRSILLILCCLLMVRMSTIGQEPLSQQEQRLAGMFDSILRVPEDSTRLNQAAVFLEELSSLLKQPGSFEYPFQKMKNVSLLQNHRKSFRLFTYSIPLQFGRFHYVGLIQQKTDSMPRVVVLLEDGDKKIDAAVKTLDRTQWYGAIYYEMIEKKHKDQLIYTLLGWDGNDFNSNRKVIEVLTFDPNGEPHFGLPVFRGGNSDSKCRVVFEFAENAVMTLRYDQQYIITSSTWNAARRRYDITRKRVLLIVFDRLVPLDERLPDDKRFHVPALDAYDGFIFRDGYWEFVPNVEVRNSEKN